MNLVAFLILMYAQNTCPSSKKIYYAYDLQEIMANYDFCGVSCDDPRAIGKIHVACARRQCYKEYWNEEYTMNNRIRREMLLTVNDVRNKAANGLIEKTGSTKSSRMFAVSYDMFLEFMATCVARVSGPDLNFTERYGYCTNTPNYITTRQFILRGKEGETPGLGPNCKNLIEPGCFKHSLEQIYLPNAEGLPLERIQNFYKKYNEHVGSTTFDVLPSLLYGRMNAFGCASTLHKSSQVYYVYCVTSVRGFNREAPLYKIGEPCASCPLFEPCNPTVQNGSLPTFNGLCGGYDFIPYISRGGRHFFTLKYCLFLFILLFCF